MHSKGLASAMAWTWKPMIKYSLLLIKISAWKWSHQVPSKGYASSPSITNGRVMFLFGNSFFGGGGGILMVHSNMENETKKLLGIKREKMEIGHCWSKASNPKHYLFIIYLFTYNVNVNMKTIPSRRLCNVNTALICKET